MPLAAVAPPAPAPLPTLRADLRLLPARPEPDGAACWSIFDPGRNRYFRIGRAAFACLAEWHRGDVRAVLDAANARTEVHADALERLVRFLETNNLTERASAAEVKALLGQAKAVQPGLGHRLLHNYLFVRIPLVRPDRFLEHTLPYVDVVFRRRFWYAVLALGLVGVLLALRQWDTFVTTFLGYLSWQGALHLGAALVVAKLVHELGHAYTAKRFGCRVPTMGVALMVLYPVLYTDTTDAWRLVTNRQRLLIGGAGMIAELGLALLATFAWAFLPEGPLRAAAFLLATLTWTLTLVVNLNPCLRFDGYYLLADFLGVANLQSRAFALGRWHLRETLLGLGAAPPEVFAPHLRRTLILYAYGTWLFRFFLFLGIAVLIYHFMIKVVGIALMLVELTWFIGRPIWHELCAWWRHRQGVRPRRALIVGLGIGLLGALAVWPWHARVHAPGVIRAADQATLYPPEAARVERVLTERGARVRAGEALIALDLPDLDHRIEQVRRHIALLERQIATGATSAEGARELVVLRQEQAGKRAELAGLERLQARLVVTSPIAGRVVDLPEELSPGLWVAPTDRLGDVVGESAAEVWAFVAGDDLARLEAGAPARFYPDDPSLPPRRLRVVTIEHAATTSLEVAQLASVHGGPITVERTQDDRLRPTTALYRVVLAPQGEDAGAAPPMVLAGTAQIEGPARSLVDRLWRTVLAVLVRESGF